MVRWIRRTIALLEVAAGLSVLALFTWFLVKAGGAGGWMLLTMQSFAVLSIAAGILLWRDKPLGYELSMVVQGAQVLRFYVIGFGFITATGPEVLLGWSERGLYYYLGAHAQLSLGRQDAVSYFALNLFALGVLVLLRRGHAAVENQARRDQGAPAASTASA